MDRRTLPVFGAGVWGVFFQVDDPVSGIPIWVWGLLALLVVGLIVMMVGRRRGSPTDQRGDSDWSQSPQMDELRPQVVEVRGEGKDDLTVIEGIGPDTAVVLMDAGITTFDHLAETNVDQLEEILRDQKMSLMDPETWPEQARMAAQGRMDDLRRYQETLRGGRTH
jgi:predicted flap endonuclease-1-like 5' DNA nuclease